MKKGADPGTCIWDVPLIYLISNTVQSKAEVYVKMLLERGADPNATYPSGGNMHKGETALFPAAITGNAEIVRLLIKAKADVNHQSDRGITALGDAARNKHYKVVHVLLEAGAELGESPVRGLLLALAQDLAENDPSLKDPWRTKVVAWVEEHGYDLQPAIIEARRREVSRRQKIEERKRLWGDQDK